MNVLSLYSKNLISYEEMMLMYILIENKTIPIKILSNILNNNMDIKDVLEILYNKGYIEIDWDKNIIHLIEPKTSNIIENKNSSEIISKQLSITDIDKVRNILNREIKPYELTQMQEWFKTYTIEQILEAVYKAILKNIDNFNYIEKILSNKVDNSQVNKPSEVNNEEKVQKNFNFFKK